ncbi:MAG: hypothetical protein KF715_09245 [Candidatus Didemnitutus sp.]|nr:hypothetical protein [Candidatus Didemnitutus sp.]
MQNYRPAKLRGVDVLASSLETAAVALARHLRQRLQPAPRSRGATLRPGVETPLWLALREAVRGHLRSRGAKALLARELSLDPARMTEFFVNAQAMPDAERTLELLAWLGRQRRPETKRSRQASVLR